MLAKVILLKKSWKTVASAANYVVDDLKKSPELSEPGSYEPADAANYLARDGVLEAASFNLEGLNPVDPDDRRQIIKLMDGTARAWAARSKANPKTNPFYHVVLSWRAGEQPTLDQATAAAAKALKAVCMADNQAFFAIHRDKDHHHHIHIIANRVHPDHLILTGPPRYDFLVLDKTCREIELEQGWQHDNGPYVVIEGQINRLTHALRRQLGLVADKSLEPHAPAVKARMGEVKAGLPSLAGWLKNKVAPELVATQNWQAFHRACAARGLSVVKVKSGLIFETPMLDKATQTKASAVHYALSLGRLQNRFGEYQPLDIATGSGTLVGGPLHGATYNDYVARVACGTDPDSQEHPGRTGRGEQRDHARLDRAAARTALFDQYKSEKYTAKDGRKVARSDLRTLHRSEKSDLFKQLAAAKAGIVADLQNQYGNQVARSLWAAKRTAAMEDLADRQRCERLAFTHANAMEWLPWLERQAVLGNQAAISALRGLRYRAQREHNRQKAGIEGEDLGHTVFPTNQQLKFDTSCT
ncbi:MAG: relaxase/mobilization nuclease domain-containing protein [Rhodoferax sp.]|nr:relaxase/mobilization nuclease domain-containing protein [Rhodoferax sp.]